MDGGQTEWSRFGGGGHNKVKNMLILLPKIRKNNIMFLFVHLLQLNPPQPTTTNFTSNPPQNTLIKI